VENFHNTTATAKPLDKNDERVLFLLKIRKDQKTVRAVDRKRQGEKGGRDSVCKGNAMLTDGGGKEKKKIDWSDRVIGQRAVRRAIIQGGGYEDNEDSTLARRKEGRTGENRLNYNEGREEDVGFVLRQEDHIEKPGNRSVERDGKEGKNTLRYKSKRRMPDHIC